MKKLLFLLMAIALAGFVLVTCAHEVVSYCPFCGKSDIKEISVYDKDTGITTIYYKCQNDKCGKTFGAGKI